MICFGILLLILMIGSLIGIFIDLKSLLIWFKLILKVGWMIFGLIGILGEVMVLDFIWGDCFVGVLFLYFDFDEGGVSGDFMFCDEGGVIGCFVFFEF